MGRIEWAVLLAPFPKQTYASEQFLCRKGNQEGAVFETWPF